MASLAMDGLLLPSLLLLTAITLLPIPTVYLSNFHLTPATQVFLTHTTPRHLFMSSVLLFLLCPPSPATHQHLLTTHTLLSPELTTRLESIISRQLLKLPW